jgi:hypothetical protein
MGGGYRGLVDEVGEVIVSCEFRLSSTINIISAR